MTDIRPLLVSNTVALLFGGAAWAQGSPGPAPAVPPASPPLTPPAPPPVGAGTESGTLFVIGTVVALIAIIAIVAKIYDLRRRREADAVALQARLSDALLTDSLVQRYTVTPTAHVPTWRGSPVIVEITGDVPNAAAREVVLRVIEREARTMREDVELVDKLTILPSRHITRIA